MLSIETMAILGIGALVLFGPEQLPVIMKKAGRMMREVQNTSQSFIREMERAADDLETTTHYEPPKYEPPAHEAPEHAPPATQADVPPYSPS